MPEIEKVKKYSSDFSRKAFKYWKKCSAKVRNQIDKHLDGLESGPYSGWPLHGEYEGYWAKDSGEFRIVYTIDKIKMNITFVKIGPRGDVYK